MPLCSMCSQNKPTAEFSASQLRKCDARRCAGCVRIRSSTAGGGDPGDETPAQDGTLLPSRGHACIFSLVVGLLAIGAAMAVRHFGAAAHETWAATEGIRDAARSSFGAEPWRAYGPTEGSEETIARRHEMVAEQRDDLGHVFRVTGLLTDDESRVLRTLVSPALHTMLESGVGDDLDELAKLPGGATHRGYASLFVPRKGVGNDGNVAKKATDASGMRHALFHTAAFQALDARIAALTGIPPNNADQFLLSLEKSFDPHLRADVRNFHVDSFKGPDRAVSLLVHLEAETPTSGGETIFPCASPRALEDATSASPRTSTPTPLCHALNRSFWKGERFVSVKRAASEDQLRTLGTHGHREALTFCEAVRQQQHKPRHHSTGSAEKARTRSGGLSVSAARGEAIMFRVSDRYGPRHRESPLGTKGRLVSESVNSHLWHTGCRVHGGGEKLLLVVFKALPPSAPPWARVLRKLDLFVRAVFRM